jgi:Tfp pilus assembly protein PilN
MIRINLLGKKKLKGPLGIDVDDLLGKLGYKGKAADLLEYKGQAAKILALVVILYLLNIVPQMWLERELAKSDVQFKTLDEQLTAFQKELEGKKTIRAQMNKLQTEEGEIKRQLDIISSLAGNRSQVFRTVERLSALLPEKAWLDVLDLTEANVRLSGSAWDYTNINDFVRSLTENVQFSNIQLQAIASLDNPNPVSGVSKHLQKIKNFTVEFAWRSK